MDDYISRQAAIDAVYDAFSYAYCDNCEKELNEDLCGDCHRKYQNWSASKKTIEKVINNLPSAQQWIPCSERLPKPNEEDAGGFIKAYLVQDGRWMDVARWDGDYWVAWGYGAALPNVTAWMPLPEPYVERRTDALN